MMSIAHRINNLSTPLHCIVMTVAADASSPVPSQVKLWPLLLIEEKILLRERGKLHALGLGCDEKQSAGVALAT